ncbi:MAG: hypothetical protein NUV81_04415 [bacterium]|nr:hypothetical protein [bacterium]
MISILALILFWLSLAFYVIFWCWAVIHAYQTPGADPMQKRLWCVALVVNPLTAVWYWYIWKKWAFIALFTPLLIAFISFPFAVRMALSHAEATAVTNLLFSFGSGRLVILTAILMVFPLLLRLVAILDLGKNTKLTAMDRNDWIVAIALPIFGFGAAIAYCARARRGWALVGLIWWIVIVLALLELVENVSPALIEAGNQLRETIIQTRGV